MKKLLFTLSIATGFALMMIVAWLALPAPCYSCGPQTVRSCTANLSGFTLHKGDPSREWWQVLKQDDHTMKIYLALNRVAGNTPGDPGNAAVPFEYEIKVSGDWDPNSVSKGITPASGAGILGAVGTVEAHQVIEITIPYSDGQSGDLVVTSTVKSGNTPAANTTCNFALTGEPLNNTVTTTTKLRIEKEGPTVWPIFPTSCPVPGEKPTLSFGVRNFTNQTQTYNIFARALNVDSKQDREVFTLNGQSGLFNTSTTQGANREIQIPSLTLRPWQTELVKLTCETFEYCQPGATNNVVLRVKSASGGNNAFESSATSSLTIRSPNVQCPVKEDWGTVMPPWLAGTLAGLTTLIGGYLSCTALTAMFSLNGNDGMASFVADHCIWIWPLAIGAAVFAATYGYIF